MKTLAFLVLFLFGLNLSAQEIMTIGKVFDYNIGDKFHLTKNNQTPNAERLTIIGKTFSANLDTVFYKIARNNYSSVFNLNTEPHLIYFGKIDTVQVNYTNLDSSIFTYYTGLQYDTIVKYHAMGFSYDTILINSPDYCERLVNGFDCTISSSANYHYAFGKGLGLIKEYVEFEESGGLPTVDKSMIYFNKAGIECGTQDTWTAQTSVYHPFPDKNAKWNFNFSLGCWTGNSDENYSILMSNDTIINEKTYQILTTPFVQSFTTGDCEHIKAGYKGAIRHDSFLKKVFFIPPTETEEQLLYDFNLQVGDTVKGYLEISNFPPDTVISIDSIFVDNGYRKRWKINNGYNVEIIEGIGSTFGLVEPSPGNKIDVPGYSLNCFQQNMSTIYPNSSTICETITAQYESVFGNVSTSWNLFQEIIDAVTTDSLFVLGDTSVNSIEYKIVKEKRNGGIYFIRDSPDNSKVYSYAPNVDNSEFLVFDLNLEVSDTFNIGINQNEPIIVDSVYTLNSKKHIRFNYEIEFVHGLEKLEFIEGIGTNFGLFYQGIDPYYIGKRHYLLCEHKNGELSYSNKSYNGICYVDIGAGIGQSFENNLIKVYPNPTNSIVMIEFENLNSESYILNIYDSLGQIVLINKNITQNQIQLNFDEFNSGFYYFSLINKVNGQKEIGKIIKNAR